MTVPYEALGAGPDQPATAELRVSWLGRLLCRLSIHGPRPPVLYGDDPWPVRFQCARCGVWALDFGPEH